VDWKVKLSNSSKKPGWLLLVGLEKRVMRHRLAAPLGLNRMHFLSHSYGYFIKLWRRLLMYVCTTEQQNFQTDT
jgi:hypothetical protein